MAKPLLEVLRDVSLDPTERAAFAADPADYLAQHGYEGVSPDDLGEAFGLMHDTLPAETAQALIDDPVYRVPASDIPSPELAEVGDIAPFGDVNGDFDAVHLQSAADADAESSDRDADDNDDDLDLGGDEGPGDLDSGGDESVELGAGFDVDPDAVAFGTGSDEGDGDLDPGELAFDSGHDLAGAADDVDDLDTGGPAFDSGAFGTDVFGTTDDLEVDDLDTGAFGYGHQPADLHEVDDADHSAIPDEPDDIGLF